MRLKLTVDGSTGRPDALSIYRIFSLFPKDMNRFFRPATSFFVLHLSTQSQDMPTLWLISRTQLFRNHLGEIYISMSIKLLLLTFFTDSTKEIGIKWCAFAVGCLQQSAWRYDLHWFTAKLSVMCWHSTALSLEMGACFMFEWFIDQC